MLTSTVASPPVRGADGDHACSPSAALLEFVALAISPVAAVYTEPANVVTTPAPLSARVIAAPPAEVMTVAALPPIALTDW